MVGYARFVRGSIESVIAVRSADAEVLTEGVGGAVEGGRHRPHVGNAAAIIVGRRAVERILGNAAISVEPGI